jgi:hypothetical protein
LPVRLLSHAEPGVRFLAIRALGNLRTDARPALPALRAVVRDRSEVVEGTPPGSAPLGLFAKAAMLRIAPDALTEAADRP